MAVREHAARGWIVLSPRDALVAGGPAEDLEQLLQRLFREGHRHLVADLQHVTTLDSAGVRAIVRAHATAQRVGGHFHLAGVRPPVRAVLAVSRLDQILHVFASVDEASRLPVPWRDFVLALLVVAVSAALFAIGSLWPAAVVLPSATLLGGAQAPTSPVASGALRKLVELVAAAVIGFVVTAVHKRQLRERPMTRSMEQAQVLLCVSGALMMIIIGDNLARAFGIAGAAGIIRFRTPVEDPKDVTILFLLMGLGMACGMGALAVAGLGTLFLCLALLVLDLTTSSKPRLMHVEITAIGRQFPIAHVLSVFAHHGIHCEPREVTQGSDTVISYTAALPPGAAIEDVSAGLVGDGSSGIRKVAWEPPKKRDAA
jgi:anti-anti-sigma factor